MEIADVLGIPTTQITLTVTSTVGNTVVVTVTLPQTVTVTNLDPTTRAHNGSQLDWITSIRIIGSNEISCAVSLSPFSFLFFW